MKKDKNPYSFPFFRQTLAFHASLLDSKPQPDSKYCDLQALLEISGEQANAFEDPDDLSQEVAVRLEEHPLYPKYQLWRKDVREDHAQDYVQIAKVHLQDAFYELCVVASYTTKPSLRDECYDASRQVISLLYRLCKEDGPGIHRLLLGLDRAGIAAVETADADDYRSLDWLQFLDVQAQINEADK